MVSHGFEGVDSRVPSAGKTDMGGRNCVPALELTIG